MFEGKGCDLGFDLGNRRLKRVNRRRAPGLQGLADVGFNVQLSGILSSFSTQVEVASHCLPSSAKRDCAHIPTRYRVPSVISNGFLRTWS